MWWNKKKVEEKVELTEEQKDKIKALTDLKQTVFDNVFKAIEDNDVKSADNWLDLFEKIKNYRYNF